MKKHSRLPPPQYGLSKVYRFTIGLLLAMLADMARLRSLFGTFRNRFHLFKNHWTFHAVLFFCLSAVPAAKCQNPSGYEEGVIYLKVADTSSVILLYPSTGPGNGPNGIYGIFDTYGVSLVETPFVTVGEPYFDRAYRIFFEESGEVLTFLQALEGLPFVDYAEQVPLKMATDIPNDELWSQQFHLGLIKAEEAFGLHHGGSLIAIVDNAVLTSHEDLIGTVIGEYDVADKDNNANPPTTGAAASDPLWAHGTNVTGVAGAETNNNIGVASIGWNNQIYAVKCTPDDEDSPLSIPYGIDGIKEATSDHGVRVINLSWGSVNYSQLEYTYIKMARDHGLAIVAGAGNDNSSIPFYPAAYGEGTTKQIWEASDSKMVIAVASIDADGKRSVWGETNSGTILGSNLGSWVDISSYGTGILSTSSVLQGGTLLTDRYDVSNGTSMAAPLVAGLIGLMISYRPDASIDEILSCLLSTANDDIYDPNITPPNLPGSMGSGRINAYDALRCIDGECQGNSIASIYAEELTICLGGSTELTANQGDAYLWSTNETSRSITVNVVGTYTVTVTLEGGCSSTATIDISAAITTPMLIVSDISGHTHNDGLLCGNDQLYLTAWWGNSYQWDGGSTLPTRENQTASPNPLPHTRNYSVTVTDVGGCAGVTGILTGSATWYPLPDASVSIQEASQIPNDGRICLGHSATLTATGGVQYLWSNGETTSSITVSPNQINADTDYSVTVSDANGCTDVGFAGIWVGDCPPFACGCPPDGLNFDVTAGGGYYSAFEKANNYDTNDDGILDFNEHHGCIAINGKLIVDQDLSIINCSNIKMQPHSEIVVGRVDIPNNHPKLSLNTNNIYGCEQMWKGITVMSRCTLQALRNGIADAEFAVRAYASSAAQINSLHSTTVAVRYNFFQRNHVGISFENPENLWAPVVAHAPLLYNTFDGAGPLLPESTPDLEHYVNTNGFAGVVSQGPSLGIGTPGSSGYVNTFRNLRNGVLSSGGFENHIYRADFQNMLGYLGIGKLAGSNGFTEPKGIGVGIQGGFNLIQNCRFNGCGHAVYAANLFLLDVSKNQMPDVQTGVQVVSPNQLTIKDNHDILFRDYGIHVTYPGSGFFLRQRIENNRLTTLSANPNTDPASQEKTIYVASAINMNMQENSRIASNIITLKDNIDGIRLENTNNWLIDANHVTFQESMGSQTYNTKGFALFNSNHNYLYGNSVTDETYMPENGFQELNTGFYLSDAADNAFCCNATNGTTTGISFNNACDNTSLRTTDLGQHSPALECGSGTAISDQPEGGIFGINHSNKFIDELSSSAVHSGSIANVQESEFYVKTNLPQDAPAFPPVAATTWFYFTGNNTNDCPGNTLECVPPPQRPASGDDRIDQTDRAFADGTFQYSADDAALEWEGQRRLYRRLRQNPALRGQEQAVDEFYQNAQGAAIGAFYAVDSALAALSTLPPVLEAARQAAWGQVQLADSVATAQLAHLTTAVTWDDSLSLYAAAETIRIAASPHHHALATGLLTLDSLCAARAVALLPINAALPANNTLQSARKTVNRVYLETVAQGIYTLTTAQFADISPIAHQCPLEGGSAVYEARVLYQLMEQKSFDDRDYCTGNGNRPSTIVTPTMLSESGIIVQPNPAQNEILITLHKDKAQDQGATTILIHNLQGQVVQRKLLSADENVARVDVSALPSGMYVCSALSANKTIAPVRFSIQN